MCLEKAREEIQGVWDCRRGPWCFNGRLSFSKAALEELRTCFFGGCCCWGGDWGKLIATDEIYSSQWITMASDVYRRFWKHWGTMLDETNLKREHRNALGNGKERIEHFNIVQFYRFSATGVKGLIAGMPRRCLCCVATQLLLD